MKHLLKAEYANVRLRPLDELDIEQLRVWRNNKYETRFLRQIGEITPAMQKQWFRSYLQNEHEICFAIEEIEKLNRIVGSLALYDFNETVSEIGKIQIGDSHAHGLGIGRISFVMAMRIGFKILGFKKIIAAVHKENIPALKNYMTIGFEIVGEHEASMGGIEFEIEINEKKLIAHNSYYDDILIASG